MRKEESDPSGRPYYFVVPQDQQTPNNPMLPHWASPMQACYNPEFTPNPYYNHPPAAGSYMSHQSEADSYLNHQYAAGSYLNHQYMWQNQENNTLLQSNALHDPVKLSNKSLLAEDAAIAFSEMVSRNIVKSNPDSNQLFTRNSQPVRLITGESSEYGNQSSAPKIDVGDADRVVLVNQYYNNFFVENPSVLSQTLGTGVKESDADARLNNMDFPICKKQRSKMNVGDGENKDLSFGWKEQKSKMTVEDEKPSWLIQSLRTVVKESDSDVDADAQLKYMEADDIRKERKRQSNRESAKRTRLRKKQEREDRTKIDTLNEEIAVLTKQLKSYSEACLELADENDSIEEELIKEYGLESIADLLLMKPAA